MTTPNDPTKSHDSIDGIIAAYLLAVEAGEVPNRQELLDQHPEHADALRAFFADLDRMDRVASPLRIADGLDATGAAEVNGHAAPPTVRYFGDYELLEEIARGGMGIVYKARQVSLNRLVALKMILAGSFASSRDVQRFRSEAEAAANLDHPHIVPIFEVGEHGGQQYYSMKFVEGTSLAAYACGDLRAEVRGLVEMARAVHHAHRRGVLHRDLKPSNILVDSQGTRLVTDFGLAKRLASGEGSFTETGQVLGTPKYMAPEQAAGRKDLTVAADVYSLGVIIYERLTGQTPFAGDNALTLLRQARESEPPRPSSIRPGLNRDLETVVLKCLEKEPGRRYPSAEALADDLECWLSGRPIAARPVGQAERLWRWCRRNPTIAGLTAAVAALLIVVAAVSTDSALRERDRARTERRERLRAESAEKEALAAREEALAARDDIERTFARSLARPLDPIEVDASHEALTSPEKTALWELAGHQHERLALRFIDEAIRDPLTLSQLRARREPALIATVGLDVSRRDRVSEHLFARIHEPSVPPRQKADLALIALELEDRHGDAAERCVSVVMPALAAEPSSTRRDALMSYLFSLVLRHDPHAFVRDFAGAWEADASIRRLLVEMVGQFGGRFDRSDSASIARRLAVAIEREDKPSARCALASQIAACAKRLDPTDAERTYGLVARILIDELEREVRLGAEVEVAQWIYEAVNPLGRSKAERYFSRAAPTLADALERQTEPYPRAYLASSIDSVAGRLKPNDAGRLTMRLTDALARWGHEDCEWGSAVAILDPRTELVSAIGQVAASLTPDDAERLVGRLVDEMGREPHDGPRDALATAIVAVAGRLDRGAAARVCGRAAARLADALEREADPDTGAVSAIVQISGGLDPSDANRLIGRLADALERQNLVGAETPFSMARESDPRGALASAIEGLAGRVTPSDAGRLAMRLADELKREKHARARYALASAIGQLAARLDRIDAARVCDRAAAHLVDALEREKDAMSQSNSAMAIPLVAERLDPNESARLAARLVAVAERMICAEAEAYAISPSVSAIAACVRPLGPDAAERVCGPTARLLVDAVGRATDGPSRSHLVSAIVSIAQRIGKDRANELCSSTVVHLMRRRSSEPLSAADRSDIDRLIGRLLPFLSSRRARALAAEMASIIVDEVQQPDDVNHQAADLLSAYLPEDGPQQQVKGPLVLTMHVPFMIGMPGTLSPLIYRAAFPPGCRLTTQQLIDLLKMPTCCGQARRVVLDHLGYLQGRSFVNHWAFVRFARERRLDVDLTSPPRRPDPRASVERMLAILREHP